MYIDVSIFLGIIFTLGVVEFAVFKLIQIRKELEEDGRRLDPVLQPYYRWVKEALSTYSPEFFKKDLLQLRNLPDDFLRLRNLLEALLECYRAGDDGTLDYRIAKGMFDPSAEERVEESVFGYMYILKMGSKLYDHTRLRFYSWKDLSGYDQCYAGSVRKDSRLLLKSLCMVRLKLFAEHTGRSIPEFMWDFFALDKKDLDSVKLGE